MLGVSIDAKAVRRRQGHAAYRTCRQGRQAKPEASLLIKAVRYLDPDLRMPPKNRKLSQEQIALLEGWVKAGAPMPA